MNLTNEMILGIGIFFILQLINVILSTIRSILTINASPSVAAIFNAFSYTFYNMIVKLITSQDMVVIMIVTFLTNLLGVYIGRLILSKVTKDKLWVFTATVKEDNEKIKEIVKLLKEMDIKSLYNEVTTNLYSMQIFSYSQKESVMIKSILDNYNVKYYATETKK